jgi:GlpG protein
MRPPPSLALFHQFPVISSITILAVVAMMMQWKGDDISFLYPSGALVLQQPWRLLTSALPHGNLAHLAFNLYWLWVFGTVLEKTLGSLRLLGMVLLLAAGSDAAELAIFDGGIGLSGVSYGMFALLWFLNGKDARFAGTIDRRTVVLFVAWFFFCIWTTITGLMPVGNVAHGMGAVLGASLGWVLTAQGKGRILSRACLGAQCLLLALGVTVARPYINRSPLLGPDLAYQGYRALLDKDNQKAVRLFEQAVALNSQEAGWWYNLGIAHDRLGHRQDALNAWRRAVALEPNNKLYQSAQSGFEEPIGGLPLLPND